MLLVLELDVTVGICKLGGLQRGVGDSAAAADAKTSNSTTPRSIEEAIEQMYVQYIRYSTPEYDT